MRTDLVALEDSAHADGFRQCSGVLGTGAHGQERLRSSPRAGAAARHPEGAEGPGWSGQEKSPKW